MVGGCLGIHSCHFLHDQHTGWEGVVCEYTAVICNMVSTLGGRRVSLNTGLLFVTHWVAGGCLSIHTWPPYQSEHTIWGNCLRKHGCYFYYSQDTGWDGVVYKYTAVKSQGPYPLGNSEIVDR